MAVNFNRTIILNRLSEQNVNTQQYIRYNNREMLNIFFEKSGKVNFLSGEKNFMKVSNNLDSHTYILQRVKDGDSKYIIDNYFQACHPQLVNYYTSWKEREAIQMQALVKKPKDKKGIMGGVLNKKIKGQPSLIKLASKETKEQTMVTVIEDVLYIQLQSFWEAVIPIDFQEIKQFMALIYLLAMRIFQQFAEWPQMIPVMAESRRYKFIKKGKDLQFELIRLYEFVKNQKNSLLKTWSEVVFNQLFQMGSEEEKTKILCSFLRSQLQRILQSQFVVRLKIGSQYVSQIVTIEDAFTLVLKKSEIHIVIDEYEISYIRHESQKRQIILDHNFNDSIVLEGTRTNLIIMYLKQFVRD